jgi:dephospho-CoA kinase
MTRARTFVVGIAGGSGTGKTTVAAHLARLHHGVHVDGDRVAHAVLEDDADVKRRLREAFGPDVFGADGKVERRALGRRVFADAGALRRLNAVVHPAVAARCADAVARARAAGVPLVAVDAALLLEVAMPFRFDLTLALTCDLETRVRRLLAAGGRTEAEVRDRLDRQAGMEKHFYKADAVVDTGRHLPAVLSDVEALVGAALRRRKGNP